MAPRLPTTADFPSSLQLTVTPPLSSAPRNANVLILLHGLGDTFAAFTALGRQLALPETVCISLQAPTPLPFELGGFHWGDDIVFDQSSGGIDMDTGFSKAVKTIKHDCLEEGLIQKCGYTFREILLFGFGQGGMAALAAASSIDQELGGTVSVGGPLPASNTTATKATVGSNPSPIMVLGGSSNTMITRSAIQSLRASFKIVEYNKWDRPGDGMPRSREEMLPIMRFFARRLRSQQGVPEGSVEIG